MRDFDNEEYKSMLCVEVNIRIFIIRLDQSMDQSYLKKENSGKEIKQYLHYKNKSTF